MALAVEVHERSPASIERVWALVGYVANWPKWSFITKGELEVEGSPEREGVGAIRRLSTGGRGSREQVTVWDPPHRLGYRMLAGLPLDNYESMVTLTPDGTGTLIHWRSTFDARYGGTGALMRAVIKLLLSRFARGLAKEAAVVTHR